MRTRASLPCLILLAALLPFAARAATPEDEAKFVDAVKAAFDAKKPADLSGLTCWDRVSADTQTKEEQMYADLVNDPTIAFTFKLEAADLKDPKAQAISDRANLKITRQLHMTLTSRRDGKILAGIGFAVVEKDGKLLFAKQVSIP